MNTQEYHKILQTYCDEIEAALVQNCRQYLNAESIISEAVQYSLLSGGKRIRGCLVLAFCDLFAGQHGIAIQFACAIEMVHAYSLIHDDLPCMDNDDIRRGKPSCHKQFGEATALLAGDALLTMAFQCISDVVFDDNTFLIKAIQSLSKAAGPAGMILGQELDLYYETHIANEKQLFEIHRNKTGALIQSAMELGCFSAKQYPDEACVAYIKSLGVVFQVVDDILDATSTTEILGKTIGSDMKNNKTTFVSLYGLEDALTFSKELTQKAVHSLEQAHKEKALFLIIFANKLLVRQS